jgi:hypothetical protein
MKDNKHIQSFNEHQENLNISDVSGSYSDLQNGMKVEDKMGNRYTITFVDYKLGVELTPSPYRFQQTLYFPNDFEHKGNFWEYFTLIN